MKFKIQCQPRRLLLVLLMGGALSAGFIEQLGAMSAAAQANRNAVQADLKAQIANQKGAFKDIWDYQYGGALSVLNNFAATPSAANAASVSNAVVMPFGSKTLRASVMDIALQSTNEGFNGQAVYDLLFLGAPAKSLVGLSPSASDPNVLALYNALQSNSPMSASVCSAYKNLQGLSCSSNNNCCPGFSCVNGVCDAGSAPATCPTVPCPSGYSCVSGTCVQNPPTGGCTVSGCPTGRYCSGSGASSSCVPGCLSKANCGGSTSLCDTTVKACVAQIPATHSGCTQPSDCVGPNPTCTGGVCGTASSCGALNAGCAKPSDCCSGVCDTSAAGGSCVTQIPGTDSGCFKNTDCVSGCCSSDGSTCSTGTLASAGTCIAKPAGCTNPAAGSCGLGSPCCPNSICDTTSNTCFPLGGGQIKTGDGGCFQNSDCVSNNCGGGPGAARWNGTGAGTGTCCIPGVTAPAQTAANYCTPRAGESAANTQCCQTGGSYTCYPPAEGSGTNVCQPCTSGAYCPPEGNCMGNDGSGGGPDDSCCSGQCNNNCCIAVS